MLAETIGPMGADLVMIGCQAHDEMEGALGPVLALKLGLPYVGVIRGVKPGDGTARVQKEFPGAVMAEYDVQLPVVLGILAAEQPPRYVSVSRIRGAMGTTQFEEAGVAVAEVEPAIAVRRMYPPETGERAEMITGSEEEVAARIVELLVEKGVMK
jgi:electron transfer flavoprotein beta subunit